MARRSYSKPHSVGFETVKSSNGFPAARCAASASLSRFGARFQLVRFANMNCAGTLGELLPEHYIRGTPENSHHAVLAYTLFGILAAYEHTSTSKLPSRVCAAVRSLRA